MYSTKCKGIGGRIKQRIADFQVEEITPQGKVCSIKAFNAEGKINGFSETDSKILIPENPENSEFLICEMEKFNYDLNMAVRFVSHFLQSSRKRVGYAGLKDKRAITCQRVSLWKPDLERLEKFKSRFIDLRPLEWSAKRVEIGDLKANNFRIAIRNIELEEKECRERILEFAKEAGSNGVANFFGEQRFGGIRAITHEVGRFVIQGKLKNAVMLYLGFVEAREKEESTQARNLVNEGKFAEALALFPKEYRFEKSMLNHLVKNPEDFAGAIGKLPKAMRYLFTHAFQSHLYNRIIEERIKQGFGLKEIEGDLKDDEGNVLIPLIGFESKMPEGKSLEIVQKILDEESVKKEDFKVRQMPELSSKGAAKKLVLKPRNFELLEIGKDEFNEGKLKAVVSFELEKGAYATTVLAELLKQSSEKV
ncbi:MAG TPA: tRNA pseudouridine(13) synthase TruD [Candidatus Diapherotrites archaeon]|uniref:Probable tRNA pseudouridine synthase D n=1 Tax=Candidatus Iainarchaeum sp. TaxID=3101447 RepID=A0A7J4L0X9_9ARCH|nr:tRNA pseudouridine(13) synthase TruD [Candidatus Diapherotrites archaeon]